MSNNMVSPDDVGGNISYLERLVSNLGPEDELLKAILANQITLSKALVGGESSEGGGARMVGGIDTSSLPINVVGTALGDISSGDRGKALFEVNGTTVITNVRANNTVESGESVRVVDNNNTIAKAYSPSGGSGASDGIDQPSDRDYFSTGPDEHLRVTSAEYDDPEKFDELVDTMVLFFDSDIVIAFDNPEEDNKEIPLTSSDSPASFSPGDGLFKDTLYYRKKSSSQADFDLQVLAYYP